MNYMKQVAEMLGVEMGERFNIDGFDGDFYFSNNGIESDETDDVIHTGILQRLLDGTSKIIEKQWKPKRGDKIYYVTNEGKIFAVVFDGCTFTYTLILMGNCFRTREDAEAHKDEVMAKFKEAME